MKMGLIELIVAIAVFGFVVWLCLQIPMPAPFKNIIVGVVCLALVLWLLQSFGLIHNIGNVRIK